MWILRYLILATRQRCNALLDRRTRMNFDPLHGCPMYVCADKAEWDRRGREQVAQLESELRQDIEAYHTKTGERRVIAGEMIEVRPVVLEKAPEPVQAAELDPESEAEETILPEAATETEAAPAQTGDALVSSGVEAQAEAEPGAAPTLLGEDGTGTGAGGGQDSQDSGISGLGTETELTEAGNGTTDFTSGTDQNRNQSQLQTGAPSTEVPEPAAPPEAAAPKAKTKPVGKAGKK